jgi:hypothetical protein
LRTLRIKLDIAVRRHRQIAGAEPLLASLAELGDTPIQVIGLDDPDRVWALYVNVERDVVAGCLLIEKN